MQRKSLKSGIGSASVNATAKRAARLAAKSWFDSAKKGDSKYIAFASDLAILDGKSIEGEDKAAKRKSFRRQIRNAIKSAFPTVEGVRDPERDWQVEDGEYILPHDLVATLDDSGVAHIRKFSK